MLRKNNNKRGSSSKPLPQVNVKLYPWQWTSLDNIWAYWENSDVAIIFGTCIRKREGVGMSTIRTLKDQNVKSIC